MVDCPGSGEALRLRGLTARIDTEAWAAACVDHLLTRPDVDPARIGLAGWSLGGYFAPRAAAFEERLALVVAWGANRDGLGHIFDRGMAWNGRPAGQVVTSLGDHVTSIETAASLIAGRGVLLDVGRAIGPEGELPDGFAITGEHLAATIAAQGPSSAVGRGDIVLVRTGQLARARRGGWGDYAGGAAPGLSFSTARTSWSAPSARTSPPATTRARR
jgi:hypothetical protein